MAFAEPFEGYQQKTEEFGKGSEGVKKSGLRLSLRGRRPQFSAGEADVAISTACMTDCFAPLAMTSFCFSKFRL